MSLNYFPKGLINNVIGFGKGLALDRRQTFANTNDNKNYWCMCLHQSHYNQMEACDIYSLTLPQSINQLSVLTQRHSANCKPCHIANTWASWWPKSQRDFKASTVLIPSIEYWLHVLTHFSGWWSHGKQKCEMSVIKMEHQNFKGNTIGNMHLHIVDHESELV